MKKLKLMLGLLAVSLTTAAQTSGTFVPQVKKGQVIHYEYSIESVNDDSRFTDDKLGPNQNEWTLLGTRLQLYAGLAEFLNNVQTTAFSMEVLEVTPYSLTVSLSVDKGAEIDTTRTTGEELFFVQMVREYIMSHPFVFTFTRDMNAYGIADDRIEGRKMMESVYQTYVNMKGKKQTEEEKKEARERIMMLQNLRIIDMMLAVFCPGIEMFRQFYYQDFATFENVFGSPLDDTDNRKTYEVVSANLAADGSFESTWSKDYYKYMFVHDADEWESDTVAVDTVSSDDERLEVVPVDSTEDSEYAVDTDNYVFTPDTTLNENYHRANFTRHQRAGVDGLPTFCEDKCRVSLPTGDFVYTAVLRRTDKAADKKRKQ